MLFRSLPAFALDRLRRYRARQAESLLRFGVALTDESYVVTTLVGGQMHPANLGKAFRRFAQANGFDLSFHGLRHGAAVVLLLSGVDPRTAAGILGHSDETLIMRVYGHYTGSAARLAAERVNAALS